MTKNNKNWTPPSSIEEKIKKFLIPGKLYLKYLKRKHLNKGEDELHLLRFFVAEGNGAIDIGANKGIYSAVLAPLASIVHSFEPNPKLFKILKVEFKEIFIFSNWILDKLTLLFFKDFFKIFQ